MLFLYLSILFGLLHWVAVWYDHRPGILITKPLMMLSLIVWEFFYGNLPQLVANPATRPMLWFFVGLVFCTIGDIFLMFREKHFLKGLVAFLTGHIFYVVGFGTLIPLGVPWAYALGFAVLVIASGVLIYRKLYAGMLANDKKKMVLPVGFYTLVISCMLFSAIMTYPLWQSSWSLVVILGALLFYISDVINAWAEFVAPIKRHRFKIMTTYYLAELFIALASLSYYLAL